MFSFVDLTRDLQVNCALARTDNFMTTIETFNFLASIISIVLAVVAITLSILADRRSADSYQKTLEALHQIDRRAAVTESTVGANFQKMMETVLSIVKTATTDKEVQKAEAIAKGAEAQAEIQNRLFSILQEVIQAGDKDKTEAFIRVVESFTKNAAMSQPQIEAPRTAQR